MPRFISTSIWRRTLLRRREIRPASDGRGCGTLGLRDNVTREQFHALCENQNPNDGERLTQRSRRKASGGVL